MKRPSLTAGGVVCGLGLGVAVAIRLHNAFHYPADWGFDASFNWQYIYQLTRSWQLPAPDRAWATSDPPLYFYACATLLRALAPFTGGRLPIVAIPLLQTAIGLSVVALAVAMVRRARPDDARRAAIAGGLLLFLPAHIHMSAMVNEEMLAAALTSLALFLLAGRRGAEGEPARAAATGFVAGVAWMTKLTGALAAATAALTYAADGARKREPGAGALRAAAVAVAAGAVGGWFHIRNWLAHGALQPHGLDPHRIMFEMPPGERSLLDFVYLPVSTLTNPQLLDPDLLHSVWGSTLASAWFDAHRYFLPVDDPVVTRLGTVTLVLAIVPTLAFGIGVARGLRRLVRNGPGDEAWRSELPLLIATAATLAGYALFAWRNPWFAVLKATTLLGLCLPFSWYASEVLADWTRRRGIASMLTWGALAALAVCVCLATPFDLVFERTEVSGLPWQDVETP